MGDTSTRWVTLRDGRHLGYAEFGEATGKPLLYFHGFPASRLEGRLAAAAAERNHVRVIAIDRSGYGHSDFQPERRIADWPNDVVEIASALELGRFAVLGVSGGGPYALACAWRIPHHLTACGVVGGLGTVYESWAVADMQWPSRLGFGLGRRAPRLLPLVYGGLTAKLMRWRPQIVAALLSVGGPQADREVLQRAEVLGPLLASFREALRQGPRGALWEFVLYAHDWGFALRDITVPVHLWQGEDDTVVPASHGRHQAEQLPYARAHFIPGEGHFSLIVNYMDEILRTLTTPDLP